MLNSIFVIDVDCILKTKESKGKYSAASPSDRLSHYMNNSELGKG